jgi:two-component system chemotaxis response regulator CheB
VTRVLIVDDSAVARDALTECLEADGDLRVAGSAADGAAAIAAVAALRPDVVTMDIEMPGGGGLAAIEEIMARTPVPIVVVSARAGEDHTLSFEAVSRGALEVAMKPAAPADAAALRAAVRRVAGIPVIPHVRALRVARAQPSPPVARDPQAPRVVGLAASAGGPAALDAVLGGCRALCRRASRWSSTCRRAPSARSRPTCAAGRRSRSCSSSPACRPRRARAGS